MSALQRLGLAMIFWAMMWMPGANEKGVRTALALALIGSALFVMPDSSGREIKEGK